MELYIHKASVGKTNVLGITRYSDYNSAAVMLDRTREKNKIKLASVCNSNTWAQLIPGSHSDHAELNRVMSCNAMLSCYFVK